MQDLTTAISSGVTLSLGLLSTTVSVHAATGSDRVTLHTACNNDHDVTLIKQRRFCPTCDNDGSILPLIKVTESGDGYVQIAPETLALAASAGEQFKKSLALTVHPAGEVAAVLLPSGKSYYLNMKKPGATQREVYTLLGKLVAERSDLAFMTKFTFRSATSILQLTADRDGTLILHQMADADTVRKHPEIELSEIKDANWSMISSVTDALVAPFLAAEHGTAGNTIVADYASMQAPLTVVATPDVTTGTNFDVTEALKSMMDSLATTSTTSLKVAS